MDIKQISLNLKDGEATTHAFHLLNPLEDNNLKPIAKPNLSWLFVWIEKVVCAFLPKLSLENKFKTELAHILMQNLIKEHYLDNQERREAFLDAIQKAAHHVGYTTFSKPSIELSSSEIAKVLTNISGQSLLDRPRKLAFCARRIKNERGPILDAILSHLERAPLHSDLKIQNSDQESVISLSTHYSRFKTIEMDGKVNYELFRNKIAPPLELESTTNQRVVLDSSDPKNPNWIGSYCGSLGSRCKVLQQILLILQADGEVKLSNEETPFTSRILFTSLYNWKEMEEICLQRDAIESLNGRTLHIGNEKIRLELYYYNLNSIYRLPIPPHMRAFLEDLNDECIMRLFHLDSFDNLPEDFFQRRKQILDKIDRFRQNPPSMKDPIFQALVHKRRADGRCLKAMDALLYLEEAANKLSIFHNKNCLNGIDRTSTAQAADKAQNALLTLTGEHYLPGYNEHKKLFRIFYTLYLMCEEPPMNAALSLGLFENHFFKRLFYYNPQQSEFVMADLPLSKEEKRQRCQTKVA